MERSSGTWCDDCKVYVGNYDEHQARVHKVGEMEEQRADMNRMRLELELEVEELIYLIGNNARVRNVAHAQLRKVLRPLFDAKFGEVGAQRKAPAVQEVLYSLPRCEVCGRAAEAGSAFCAQCEQELREEECPECGARGGGGFVAEPRTEGGQHAVESPCGRCQPERG